MNASIEHHPNTAANRTTLAQPDANDERIKRVEEGLLPPHIIAGTQPTKMKLTERMTFHRVPGISIAVIDGSAVVWARGYGVRQIGTAKQVDPNTLFQAGEVTTVLSAMVALYHVQHGALNLDQDVNQKLTSWKIPDSPLTSNQKVTLRRLLNHSSGLNVRKFDGYEKGEPFPNLRQILTGDNPANNHAILVDFIPGSKWRYSSGGYVVLQQLLNDVTQRNFSDEATERVLNTIGLTHSTFQQELSAAQVDLAATGHRASGEPLPASWRLYPELAAQSLWTTPTDLALLVIELQKSKAGQSNKVLNQEMTQRMLTAGPNDYGLGVALAGSGGAVRIIMDGSSAGYRAYVVGFIGSGKGAVIMTNSENSAEFVQEIFRSIASEYQWPGFAPTVLQPVQVDPQLYHAFVGRYELLKNMTVEILTENGRLFCKFSGRERKELMPISETEYIFVDQDQLKIQFNRSSNGTATGLLLKLGNNVMTGRKL